MESAFPLCLLPRLIDIQCCRYLKRGVRAVGSSPEFRKGKGVLFPLFNITTVSPSGCLVLSSTSIRNSSLSSHGHSLDPAHRYVSRSRCCSQSIPLFSSSFSFINQQVRSSQ